MTAVGIAIAFVAAIVNAFAIAIQAAESRESPRSQAGRFKLLVYLARRRRWLAGTGLLILVWPLQILALGLAPITVVQPALSSGQLVLLAIARARLGERVGRAELAGALAIVVGIALVIYAAPRHTVHNPGAARLAVPLIVVGAAAVVAYVVGRLRPSLELALVIGAGLAYAWVAFGNKLLSNDIATGHWPLALAWLGATLAFGALAFLEEMSALQRRPAVTVAPVVGAIQDPLPVLMALWAGAETWGAAEGHLTLLAFGLAVVTGGAATLGRSRAVARVMGGGTPAPAAA